MRTIILGLLPLSIWLVLILSLQPGTFGAIGNPTSLFSFLQGLRVTFPLIAGFVAMVAIVIKMRRQPPSKLTFLGPLGLTAIYGLVGVVASLLSPDGLQSLYWAASYLSVPLVLWAIVWGPNAFDWIRRVVNLNWLIIVLASMFLFFFALVKLNFGSFLVSPSDWLDCASQPWYTVTSHFIRQTGVGRYAAIAAILALSRIWHPQLRSVWVLVFLVSIILLLYSGSRTPMVGFAVAAPIVTLLSGGKKAAVGSIAAIVVLAPVFWTTGIHQDFLNNCIFRNSINSSTPTTSQPSIPSAQPSSPSAQLSIPSAQLSTPSAQPSIPSAKPSTPSTQLSTPSAQPSIPSAQLSTPSAQPSTPSAQLSIPSAQPSTPSAQLSTPSAQPSTPVARPNALKPSGTDISSPELIPSDFFTFTGRTQVWGEGLTLFRKSPLLGYGFHADRLLLQTHAHNSLLHSLLQTGLIGTIPLVAAMLFGWSLLIQTLRRLNQLGTMEKTLVIQTTGVLAFLTVRSMFESTGAFFSVDWLILGPLLLYIPIANSVSAKERGR